MKVLSLAWKYHPAITSGVGVACEGLNNALSKLIDLTVIYPKISKIQVKEEVLLSVDDLTDEQFQIIKDEYIKIQKDGSFELAVRLDPYFTSKKTIDNSNEETLKKTRVKNHTLQRKKKKEIKSTKTTEKLLYDDVDIFGENVKDKIFLYNRLVEELTWNIHFDVIHAHDWMTFLAGIQLKDRFQKPLVLHIHSLEYDRVGHKDVAWVYDIERFAMSKADVVIACSEYTKGIIESNYGLSGKKVKVVYNAVTPSKIKKPNFKDSKRDFKILFAGRIDGNKGLEYFIDIARLVLDKTKDVDFIVVGKGREDLDFGNIEHFNEIKDHFHYLGYVEREELFGLYEKCDVLCMPSISEPFGLTAIEAAHAGLPVILSNKTGAAEILKDTLKANFWDIEKFSGHIISLRHKDRLYNRIVNKNKKALAGLSWDSSAVKVKSIYSDLMD